MAASPLFVCLSVTLLAASLSVEGQEDLSQLREDMAAYRQQLEDTRHEMEAQRHEMDLQRKKTDLERHEMKAQLYTLTQREKKMTQQTEGYRQQVEDMRNETEAQRSEIEAQRNEMEAQRSKIEAQRSEIEAQRNEMEAQRSEIEAQRNEMEAQRSKIEAQRSEIEAQRNEMEAQGSKIEAQRSKMQQEIKELREGHHQQSRKMQVLQETCLQHPAVATVSEGATRTTNTGGDDHKRSDDIGALEPVLSQVTQRLDVVTADIQAIQNVNTRQDQAIAQHDQAQGTVYKRWGGSACPNGTETLYSGYMGGAFYNSGSAANYLCLPHDPVFDDHPAPHNGPTGLYGVEYQTCYESKCDMTAACSVCRTPRQAQVMVPGTNVCHNGWHLEYSGYLMAQNHIYAPSEYICVDSRQDYIEASQGDQNGKLLYYTAVHCTSLSCPPYVDNKIVLCAVCSK